MGEARSKESWSHTSAVMALVANLHRDPKKTSPFKPDDFNPHSRPRVTITPKSDLGILKRVFVDRQSTPQTPK